MAWTKLTSQMTYVEVLRRLASKYCCFCTAAESAGFELAWALLASEASLDSDSDVPPLSDSGRREERRLTRGRSLRRVKGETGVDFVLDEY